MKQLVQRLEKEAAYILDHMENSAPNEVGYKDLTESLLNVTNVWQTAKAWSDYGNMAQTDCHEPCCEESSAAPNSVESTNKAEDVPSKAEDVPSKAEDVPSEEPKKDTSKKGKSTKAKQEADATPETPTEEPKEEVAKPTHTLVEIREVLSRCSLAGKDIKVLLGKYNANKLSAVVESDFDALYADAVELENN